MILKGGGNMFAWIIAVLSGALMSLQGVFNTAVTKQSSVWTTASFVQASALLVCVAAWFVTGREGKFTDVLGVSPKYLLLGGAIGAVITFTVIKSTAALGPAMAVMLILGAQLITSYLIEVFGLFGTEKVDFEWKKLIGAGLVLAGIIVFQMTGQKNR